MENQGSQTEDSDPVLAYPRGKQTDDLENKFLKLVERISMSPEPSQQRPKRTIFSHIRTPTYFSSAISSSLLIGAASGKQTYGSRRDRWPLSTIQQTTKIGRLVNN